MFDELSIRVTWFDYDGYRDYKQLWGGFEPAVSILDLLFNVGAEAPDYLITVASEIIYRLHASLLGEPCRRVLGHCPPQPRHATVEGIVSDPRTDAHTHKS